jgi:myo-inositol 2-dehydrogenase/D-chiro-inositol 1-dehydrogenase
MTSSPPHGRGPTRVRLAVAGLGAIARTAHLPLLERRRDLFEINALCDLSPSCLDELGPRYGVPEKRRHTTTASLLAQGGFDALLLLTSGSHGDDAEAALRAGYAVLCEKPLTYTRAEAVRVAAAESGQERGPRLMVGYMKQYDPAAVRLAELLAQTGAAGVRSVEVCVLHPTGEAQLEFAHLPASGHDASPQVCEGLRERNAALVDEALGEGAPAPLRQLYEAVNSSVCHEFSLLRSFVGSPESVEFASYWAGPEHGPGSLELSGRLPGPARYSVRWHYLPGHAAYRETLAVHHEGGTLELAFPSPYLMNAPTVLTATDNISGAEVRSEYRSVVEAFEQELVAFHAMVTRGKQPRTGVSGATEDLLTAQRAVARFAEFAGLPCAGEAATA